MRLFRNSSVLVALLAMAAATRPAHCAPQPRDGLRPEVLETFLRMRVVAAVLDTQAVELTYPAYPGPTDGLVPVSSLGSQVVSRVRSHGGSARDAWNNPLLYWSDGRDYLILSLGSDGMRQFDYSGASDRFRKSIRGETRSFSGPTQRTTRWSVTDPMALRTFPMRLGGKSSSRRCAPVKPHGLERTSCSPTVNSFSIRR